MIGIYPCSIGKANIAWEGVGTGLISLSSDSSLCISTTPTATSAEPRNVVTAVSNRGDVNGGDNTKNNAEISPTTTATATNGQKLMLGACSNAPQFNYDTKTSKLHPTTDSSVCIDINTQGGHHYWPLLAELWACNNNFNNGANERFTYDATAGTLTSAIQGPGENTRECLAVCE